MVILKAEATTTIEEALADNVASRIFTPPLRVATGNYFSIGPTNTFGLLVKEPRSLLALR